MFETFILVEAGRNGYARKILGVTRLGRILGELAGLGITRVNVVCEIDARRVERVVADEIPSSIEVAYITCRAGGAFETALSKAAYSGHGLICIAADLVVSRDFLEGVLTAPAGDRPLAFGWPDRALKISAAAIGKIAWRAPLKSRINLPGVEIVPGGGLCSRVSNRYELKRAKRVLLDGLRKPVEIDGLVGYHVMRPVTLKIVGLLARTRLLPNHLTIISMLIGLAGAAMVALGDMALAAAGAGLYFAACFFDCLDGELARLKYKHSYLGAWLDTLSDDIQTFFFTGAMGVYLMRQGGGDIYLALALVSMMIFALSQAYIYYQLHTVAHSGDLMDFQFAWDRKAGGSFGAGAFALLKYAIKRDFFTTLFFALFLAGAIWLALALVFASCIGFALAILYHIYLKNRERWASGEAMAEVLPKKKLADGSRA
ncbi:MAG TPA: CDP-alcohol phosphatidyltransferase family protein [Myxococcota bacterium]|nr:CDP-alcohol phosphatidyltransferase family protein [Myxococcota bacterium]